MRLNAPTNALEAKISTLTPLHKVLVIAGAVVVLGVIFYFAIYQGQAERIQKLEKEVAVQVKRLDEARQAATALEFFKANLAKAEAEFADVLALLPDQKEIPGLLESVSQLGNRVGLESVLFQPQPEQAQDFYSVIPVKIELTGTYHNLGTFLDNVSKLNRILKVENMTLIKQKGDPRLKVECLIVTYRFVEKPAGEPVKKK